jgi:hypothetical protein
LTASPKPGWYPFDGSTPKAIELNFDVFMIVGASI